MILSLSDQIAHLRTLGQGWDSYGGKPPTQEALEAAQSLAATLASAVQVVPCPSGSIQLEWHLGEWDIELYINEHGVFESSFLERRTPPKHRKLED